MPFPMLHFGDNDISDCPGCGHMVYFERLIVCGICLSIFCPYCDYLCESIRDGDEEWPCPYCCQEDVDAMGQ